MLRVRVIIWSKIRGTRCHFYESSRVIGGVIHRGSCLSLRQKVLSPVGPLEKRLIWGRSSNVSRCGECATESVL